MGYGQERWRPLDLRSRSVVGPYDAELVALRLISKQGGMDSYYIGSFRTKEGKTWFFRAGGGSMDPVKLRRQFAPYWCYLPGPEDFCGRGVYG